MITSKNALNVVTTTTADKNVKVLDNVHIEEDGSVVAANREGIVIVSPVVKQLRERIRLDEGDSIGSCTLSSDTIRDTIKFIGVDKKYKGLLEHCDIVRTPDGATITMFDGKRSKAMQVKVYPKDYFDYLSLVANVMKKKTTARVVLNRKRLKSLLDTLEKVCADSSDVSPVDLEFTDTNAMIMRGVNGKTGQRVIAICRGFKTDKWMEPNDWENRVCSVDTEPVMAPKKKVKPYVRKRRKRL